MIIMNKYINIIIISIKEQLIYRTNIMFTIIAGVFKIIFALILWGNVYKTGKDYEYTYQMMILYYIINQCICQMDQTETITIKISQEIEEGKFSKYLLLPINLKNYFFAFSIGKSIVNTFCTTISLCLMMAILDINYNVNITYYNLIIFSSLIIMGILFLKEMNFLIGILSLRFVDITAFLLIKQNVMALLVGSLLPLNLFSNNAIKIMEVFPFYYISYYPTNLLLTNNAVGSSKAIIVLVFWWSILKFANQKLFYKYRHIYEGTGM